MEGLLQAVLLIVGFFMLIKGADWFVDGASGIARKLGISQLVIGLTIVAFGTSAPEAAVSITSALKGNAGISIGNVVGSNILNILIILGTTAIIVPLVLQKSTLYVEIPFLIGVTILFAILGMSGNEVSMVDGIILWAVFLVFLAYLIVMAIKGKNEEEEEETTRGMVGNLVFTVAGLGLVVFGSDVTVDSATSLAKMVGMSDRFIGLTIVALGTSLPEFVTSILAARKGKADIAIGNIVGSNLFNILFVLGTTAMIKPIPFAQNFVIDMYFAIYATILLLLCTCKTKKVTRTGGILMLCSYVVYFVYLIV